MTEASNFLFHQLNSLALAGRWQRVYVYGEGLNVLYQMSTTDFFLNQLNSLALAGKWQRVYFCGAPPGLERLFLRVLLRARLGCPSGVYVCVDVL